MTNKEVVIKDSKYRLDPDDKQQIRVFLKRTLKVLAAILLIKGLRRYLTTNEEARELVTSMFVGTSEQTPESFIVFLAFNVMIFCLIIWSFGLLTFGKRILKMNFFNTILILGLADAVMMLVFPEVTVAVLRAGLLKE